MTRAERLKWGVAFETCASLELEVAYWRARSIRLSKLLEEALDRWRYGSGESSRIIEIQKEMKE